MFVLFNDTVVECLGRRNSMSVHSHWGYAGRQNINASSGTENVGTNYGRLLCVPFCTNILVVWIRANARGPRIRKLYGRLAGKIATLPFPDWINSNTMWCTGQCVFGCIHWGLVYASVPPSISHHCRLGCAAFNNHRILSGHQSRRCR